MRCHRDKVAAIIRISHVTPEAVTVRREASRISTIASTSRRVATNGGATATNQGAAHSSRPVRRA
jgi:hypothetical protein